MVKCRSHPYEQGVGVCASCLRERLLGVIAAQSGHPQPCCAGSPLQRRQPGAAVAAADYLPQEKQSPPAPLAFPRSVPPNVTRRRSVDQDFLPDADERRRRRQPARFFSTPQVGPPAGGREAAASAVFSIFSSLFRGRRRSRCEEAEEDRTAGPSSWFAALIRGRKKKKKNTKESPHFEAETAEDDTMKRRRGRKAWCRDRGMSPAEGESSGEDGSLPGTGYSTDSSDEWRRRPMPTPMRKPATPGHRAMSGFVVCLSPLVRASPRRSHVGEGTTAAALPGEVRCSTGLGGHRRRRHHHHQRHASGCGGPPSLGPNRSRKLVDFGAFG